MPPDPLPIEAALPEVRAALAAHQNLVLVAPPGAGKTTLVAGWLESRDVSGIWYQIDAGDADPASVFYHLGLAERALPHKDRKSRPLPLLTPELLYQLRLPDRHAQGNRQGG